MSHDPQSRTDAIKLMPEQIEELKKRIQASESSISEVDKRTIRLEIAQEHQTRILTEVHSDMKQVTLDMANHKGRWAGLAAIGTAGGVIGSLLHKFMGGNQ